MTPHCPTCIQFMTDAAGTYRCRVNGLRANPSNAEGCLRYIRDPGSDDKDMVWMDDRWVCDEPGRGD